MQPGSEQPELEGWQRFVGTWAIEATHQALPGTIAGESTFELFDGRRFVIQRSHYDHPQIPDAIAITGVTDGRLSMHYFDSRGVYRLYEVSLSDGVWRFWRDSPGFSQRFTGTFSDDGDSIEGVVGLSRDGETWEDDLAISYRRIG